MKLTTLNILLKELVANMKIYYEDINNYKPWSGAVNTHKKLRDNDKLEYLESLIEEIYPEGIHETALNDLLWFEADFIYDLVGIDAECED